MFFESFLVTTTVAIFAAQAAAAPSVITGNEMEAFSNEARTVQIAKDNINACNCPDNCKHKIGSSCKFYREGA